MSVKICYENVWKFFCWTIWVSFRFESKFRKKTNGSILKTHKMLVCSQRCTKYLNYKILIKIFHSWWLTIVTFSFTFSCFWMHWKMQELIINNNSFPSFFFFFFTVIIIIYKCVITMFLIYALKKKIKVIILIFIKVLELKILIQIYPEMYYNFLKVTENFYSIVN